MTEHSRLEKTNGTGPTWLDEVVVAICQRLEHRPTNSDRDIYVWSDGTITGPPEADDDSTGQERRVISVFTPGEHTSAGAVRESLLAGIDSVADDEETV
jgi:hypothetical protein